MLLAKKKPSVNLRRVEAAREKEAQLALRRVDAAREEEAWSLKTCVASALERTALIIEGKHAPRRRRSA